MSGYHGRFMQKLMGIVDREYPGAVSYDYSYSTAAEDALRNEVWKVHLGVRDVEFARIESMTVDEIWECWNDAP